MRIPPLVAALAAPPALVLLLAAAAPAQSLQVVSSDAAGVTLRLSLPGYDLSAPGRDGRVELSVPGFAVTGLPGRAHLRLPRSGRRQVFGANLQASWGRKEQRTACDHIPEYN